MYSKRIFNCLTIVLLSIAFVQAQDTIVVQAFNFESTTRDTMIDFPTESNNNFEKIIMSYTMRCKDGLISTTTDRNKGCGEWDYSCNTYITDSSRVDSVKAITPSYIISNFSDVAYRYTSQPTYTYHQYEQKEAQINQIISENEATVGNGDLTLDTPFSAENRAAKTRYLIRAEELTGVGGGNIRGLRLDVSGLGSNLEFLEIGMQSTTMNSIDEANIDGAAFKRVYFKDTEFETPGLNNLYFHDPFSWDGTSNIIVEFSYKNSVSGTNTLVVGHDAGFNAAQSSSGNDGYTQFNGAGALDVPVNKLKEINTEISIAFWSNGNGDILPNNSTVLYAEGNNGERQLNVHLPWGNSQIYWDCGNDGGGYDRINKVAEPEDFSGQWNFWTFTKNTNTGSMKIFLNGTLWHSGESKSREINIANFRLGSDSRGSNVYNGAIDELSIWDIELDEETIKNIMSNSVSSSHPDYDHLMAYYQFDEGTGNTASDASQYANPATFNGPVTWRSFRGNEIFKDFAIGTERPNITFLQGSYNQSIKTIIKLDSTLNSQDRVVEFTLSGTDIIEQDPVYYWRAGETYVYDESGNQVGEVEVPEEGTLFIYDIDYYRKSPSKVELLSFVTPYGIFLDFGLDGETWNFDITDFGPVLNGRKRLSMERGGQWQEEMDIKFLFIKGKPTRDVLDIQQVWPVQSTPYPNIINNWRYEARDINVLDQGKHFKVRTAITGHGQEGEFIPRTHFVNLSGGSNELQWQVWKECADNPVYPQGGTWIYDRAGWCPGAPTDVHEIDATDHITDANTLRVDYGLYTASGSSNYIVNVQLVTYGDPNFVTDAALEKIISPSDDIVYGRFNPICRNPVVKIKNRGTAPLNRVDITYGVEGTSLNTFTWTGNLGFLEEADVTLPSFPLGRWDGSHVFVASISNINNGTDENPANDALKSDFEMVPVFDDEIAIQLRTNFASSETSYYLTDMDGNTILSRSGGLSPGTTYTDTISGLQGCYQLRVLDSGDDGISFWANNDGSGMVRLRNLDEGFVSLEPDFGRVINYQFIAGTITSAKDIDTDKKVLVFPNPGLGLFNIELSGFSSEVGIEIVNQIGQVVLVKKLNNVSQYFETLDIDISEFPDGIYFLNIKDDTKRVVKRIIKQ